MEYRTPARMVSRAQFFLALIVLAIAAPAGGDGDRHKGKLGSPRGTLVRFFENDEYDPEYGTLILLDFTAPGAPWPQQPGEDREYPRDSQPSGTIARSGAGWLEGSSSDGYHRVRLEVHRRAPADDRGDWQAVAEMPYRTRTGWVGLSQVVNRSGKAQLQLGKPGLYAVRVSRRIANDGEVWSLRFWQQETIAELPRWLVRDQPPTYTLHSIWGDALGWPAEHLMRAFRHLLEQPGRGAPGVTIDEVDAFSATWEGKGWLDRPLWSRAQPAAEPTTGHADLDAQAARRIEATRTSAQEEQSQAASLAAQLGLPPPRTPRDYLAMLLAAGEITTVESGGVRRYRLGTPTPIEKRLKLPPERLARLKRIEARNRYHRFSSDILSVVFWAPRTPATFTVHALARRLLAKPEEVRATLSYLVEGGWLEVKGNSADPTAALDLRLLAGPPEISRTRPLRTPMPVPPPSAPLPPPPAPADGVRSGVRFVRRMEMTLPATSPPEPAKLLPLGAPPRAGFVDRRGRVVVWRDGTAVTLAETGAEPQWANETARGILVGGSSGVRLVQPDGRVATIAAEPSLHARIGEDGRQIAFVESHFGRRSSHRAHLVDLSSGRRESLDLSDQGVPMVSAVHGGAVYLHDREGMLRWQPGSKPVRLPQPIGQIDPLTGTGLTRNDNRLTVVRPGGELVPMTIDLSARLAPGGAQLYTLRREPPAVTLFDIPTRGSPRIHWLPAGTSVESISMLHPIWEDRHHLLLLDRESRPDLGPSALRLDIRTGATERVPLSPDAGYRPLLVQPLLRK